MVFKNQVLKCIYTRRSVRHYLDKKVLKAIINELINACVMAPSAMNNQPWHFSIVEGRDKIKHFGETALKKIGLLGWAVKAGIRLTKAESIFYNAPILIVISGRRGYEWLHDDTNLGVENMFLAAKSLGLGSCWIGFAKGLDKDDESRRELGIPENFEIVAPLIFGYPSRAYDKIPLRKPKVLKWLS